MKPLFSVTIKDCEIQTFTCGKKGGGGKDTSNNGVRIIHHPSGARGEARDTRHQKINKREAFLKMAATKEFQTWTRIQAAKLLGKKTVEQLVDESMHQSNLRVEVQNDDGNWQAI
jgi:protein subunit release factor A